MSDVKLPMDAKDDLPGSKSGQAGVMNSILSEHSELNQSDVYSHTQHVGNVSTAGDKMTPEHASMDHQEVNAHAQNVTRSVTTGKSGQNAMGTLDHKTVHLGNLGKGDGRKTSRY